MVQCQEVAQCDLVGRLLDMLVETISTVELICFLVKFSRWYFALPFLALNALSICNIDYWVYKDKCFFYPLSIYLLPT